MDALRDGVHLRAQGQKEPLVEYKNEAYKLFETLMDSIEGEILRNLFRSTTNIDAYEKFLHNLPFKLTGQEPPQSASDQIKDQNIAVSGNTGQMAPQQPDESGLKLNLPKRRPTVKVGRNDPCPCGSGKKFKQCCGREG